MRPEVHNLALRAAAKVAFSVASVAFLGCGGGTTEVPKGDTSNNLAGPNPNEAAATPYTPPATNPEPTPVKPTPTA